MCDYDSLYHCIFYIFILILKVNNSLASPELIRAHIHGNSVYRVWHPRVPTGDFADP